MSDNCTSGSERLREYIDDLRHNSERRSWPSFDTATADLIAAELEEVARSLDTDSERSSNASKSGGSE